MGVSRWAVLFLCAAIWLLTVKISLAERTVLATACTSKAHLPSLRSLLRSARLVNITQPVVMLTNADHQKMMEDTVKPFGDITVKVVPQDLLRNAHHYIKFFVWTLDADKVFWVDLDSVIMSNFIRQFAIDRPHFNGSVFYSVPDNLGCNRGDVRTSACTGFFVIKPNHNTYHKLVDKMYTWKHTDTWDQPLLNDYYMKLKALDLLPETYSSFPWNCRCGRYDPADLQIAHFTHWTINSLKFHTGDCEDIFRQKKSSLSNL